MEGFLIGTIAMALWTAGLFFLRFWRETRDRLFLIFGIAFWLLGLTRFALIILVGICGPQGEHSEEHVYVYWVRLAAFLLILLAIVDKNRPQGTSSGTDT